MATIPTLKLIGESKISELLPGDQASNRWEASGVLVKDGHFFVAFDDRPVLARLSNDMQPSNDNALVGTNHAAVGYEGITYNSNSGRFYLLVEARKQSSGCYNAVIVEYDDDFEYIKERRANFAFKSDNKGFEAVAHVRRDGKDFLLAICEGNMCKCGAKGRQTGGGRVQLFEKKKKRWEHAGTIELPSSIPFVDYSGMSVANGRVAVVSQVNSMLWVGQFDEDNWAWRDAGQLYDFPRSDDGSVLYGNIEGVGWITPSRVVTVSDRRKKKSQPAKELSEKDQSIQVFEVPA